MVRGLRWVAWGLLAAAIVAGTLDDAPRRHAPIWMGGYRVLAADFHVHPFPFSASLLLPWDLVAEGRHEGLDVIAITGHNSVVPGLAARWMARRFGGGMVLAGEEIHAAQYHVLGIGMTHTISWRLPAGRAIAEIHRQGGVAIAAHPVASTWPAFAGEAMRTLDASEVVQPVIFGPDHHDEALREFQARGGFTATGSSDYHGLGPVGLCRTYVFARDYSEAAVLEALRTGRTVVYGTGHAYGAPDLIAMAKEDGRLPVPGTSDGWLTVVSRMMGVVGLLGVAVLGVSGR